MRTVTVKLDQNDIDDVVTMLAAYRTGIFIQAISRALDRLAKEARDIIQQSFQGLAAPYLTNYDPSVTVTVKDGDKRGVVWFEVSAQGEQVGFLEFGTGALADEEHPLADNAPFPVYSGSWSNSPEGAGTWLRWIESGGDPMKYRFNREPRYGMFTASEYIKQHAVEYVVNELRRISL